MPKLSIIVPVYRVEAYLPACLDSILRQTLRDWELILIDDGSPDRCGAICDEYAENDPRIRVIHQDNHGVSAARNAGLRAAQGDYLGFVDADDLVSPEMYEVLLQEAENKGCDIAACGFSFCSEDGARLRTEPVPPGFFTRSELILSVYRMPNPFHGSMCNKIFRRELLTELAFDESVAIGEDWLLLFECYQRANGAAAISEGFYAVRQRTNSATRTNEDGLYLNKLDTYLRLYRLSRSQDERIQKQAARKILDDCYRNKLAIREAGGERKTIAKVNRLMRKLALELFLRGDLRLRQAVYYFLQGCGTDK